MTALERFVRKIELSGSCWLWTGAVSGHGYGSFKAHGRTWLAHRFSLHAFENVYLPPHKYVCHCCDNPRCVKPEHLFVGTSSANARDRNAKGRHGAVTCPERRARGETHPGAKLTWARVDEMRAAWAAGGVTQRQLAATYGVSQGQVSDIVTGKLWQQTQGGRT